MATVIKLKIQVAELDNVLSTYNSIRVYKSTTGIDGTYSLIATIALVAGQTLYEYDDLAGEISHYYKTSYYIASPEVESSLSDPRRGDDPSTANIMTVAELKEIYLFGIDLTNDAGEAFPDLLFEWSIRWAIANVERHLDIRIRPTALTQNYDYVHNEYTNWTFIKLREAPVISVESAKVIWPSNETVIEFPSEWLKLRKEDGQLNIVPSSGTLSQVLLTAGGSFLPLIASGRPFVPGIIQIAYTAGFAEGEVPYDIRDLIGKWSAFGPLNIAGDLIVGAGIASKSVSIDGLSQSINTTSSATNAGYGARLVQYAREIKEHLPMLRRYYKGIQLTAM